MFFSNIFLLCFKPLSEESCASSKVVPFFSYPLFKNVFFFKSVIDTAISEASTVGLQLAVIKLQLLLLMYVQISQFVKFKCFFVICFFIS
jgi:hypothetical protein